MPTTDCRFSHRLRVRWAEVDMQKIVFNAHYLLYFDVAITEYWRALALPYESAMHRLGGEFYLKKTTLEYHASARADDLLDVALKCARVGTSSMLVTGTVLRGETPLVSGEMVYVFADPKTQTSTPIPSDLRTLLAGYEAGEAVHTLALGPWSQLGEAAAVVRTEVFIAEQGIPQAMEWDDADHTALHAVLHNRIGQPLATGRLLQEAPGVARIGRMAVLRAMRGTRVGRQVLDALVAAAVERGDHEAVLNAQCSAEGFYRGAGFTPRGEVTQEAGIAHTEMFRRLSAGRSAAP